MREIKQGDILWLASSPMLSYEVTAIIKRDKNIQYEAVCLNCNHVHACRVIIGDNDNGILEYKGMVNENYEDDFEKRYYHFNRGEYYTSKQKALIAKRKEYISKWKEEINKCKKTIEYREKQVAETDEEIRIFYDVLSEKNKSAKGVKECHK